MTPVGTSMFRITITLTMLTAVSAGSALAQSRQADASRGAVIAAQGTGNVPACAQCHAFNGASDASGAFPRLTGLPTAYLIEQMRDFASSVRDSAIMSPIAKQLSLADIQDVSAYFAGSNGAFPPLARVDAVLVKRGETIARIGDGAKGLQACNNCHGPDGTGFPPRIPYLAGQYADYIKLALGMWKTGYRKNSPDVMSLVAKRLDDQDIAAVAAYYQQVLSAETTAAPK